MNMTSIDQLSEEYRQANLHPRHTELVTDEEINEFLIKRDNFWSALFWAVFIGSILLTGVVGK
jgi:hypothetical protein